MFHIDDIKNKIVNGNVLDVLKEIPDESVDMVITSPPYFSLRDYQAEGQIGLEKVFDCGGNCGECYMCKMLVVMKELKRIIKKEGSIWWNHGDSYGGNEVNISYATKTCGSNSILKGKLDKLPKVAHTRSKYDKCLLMQPERFAIRCVDKLGLVLRQKIIWGKSILIRNKKKGDYTIGSAMPSSVKTRFNMSWEYLFHFVRKDAKSDWYIYGNRPPEKYPEKLELWKEIPEKFRRGVWHKKDVPEKYLPIMMNLDYYANLDAVRIPHQVVGVTDLRPAGIIRQMLYKESKYNKNPDYGGQKFNIVDYKGKFSGMGEGAENFGSPKARAERKRNKTLINPNAKGLRQAPEPGGPNAFHSLGKNLCSVWQINPEPHSWRRELGVETEHFACVGEDTEILTDDGWKKYDQLQKGEFVATYNLNEKIIEYQPLEQVFVYDYDGELFFLNNPLQILMTFNHRNVVIRVSNKKKQEIIVEARNLSVNDRIKVCAPVKYKVLDSIGSERAKILGLILSDGQLKYKNGKLSNVIIHQKEGKKSNLIDKLLSKIPHTKRIENYKTNWSEGKRVYWNIQDKEFKKWIEKNCPNKTLNKKIISLPIDELNSLLEGLILGDGHRNEDGRMVFTQKDKEFIDWFEILAMRCGYHTHTTKDKNGIYFCHLTKKEAIGVNHTKKNFQKVYYKGKVWCPKTPNGTWIARRNGRIFITGNSFPEALCEIPIKFGCPENGIVLDPFGGSGTTAIVAEKLNRNWILIDLNYGYCQLAQKRILKSRDKNSSLFNNKDKTYPDIIIFGKEKRVID